MKPETRARRGDAPPVGAPLCPRCQGRLVRVHRRAVDHLVSVVYHVRRYRCTNITCEWEGNLRRRRKDER